MSRVDISRDFDSCIKYYTQLAYEEIALNGAESNEEIMVATHEAIELSYQGDNLIELALRNAVYSFFLDIINSPTIDFFEWENWLDFDKIRDFFVSNSQEKFIDSDSWPENQLVSLKSYLQEMQRQSHAR